MPEDDGRFDDRFDDVDGGPPDDGRLDVDPVEERLLEDERPDVDRPDDFTLSMGPEPSACSPAEEILLPASGMGPTACFPLWMRTLSFSS